MELLDKTTENGGIRINKYLSQAGVLSRRKADEALMNGEITINGRTAVPGDKVLLNDKICYRGKEVSVSTDELKNKVKKDKQLIGVEIVPDYNNYFYANVYSANGLSSINLNLISSSLNNIKKNVALEDYGITKNKIEKIEKAVKVDSVVLTEQVVNSNKDVSAAVTVIAFIVPCFFLITTLVQMIGSEINEEKTTKSMEIIVSNVPPKDHLLSKIEACTIFTFIQKMILWKLDG